MQTPRATLTAPGFVAAKSQPFPVLWLEQQKRPPEVAGAAIPPLELAQADVCPPERGCVWPVLLGYAVNQKPYPDGPVVFLYERQRTPRESPSGTPMRVAGYDATVNIGSGPLSASRSGNVAWEATIWLPKTVVRIYVTPMGSPDKNAFSREEALRLLVQALESLR